MAEGAGRWILVTFDLPSRSKAQRREAVRFQNWLVGSGYVALHGSAYARYLPPRAKVRTEMNTLSKAVPAKGAVYIVELTQGSQRRALTFSDGEASLPHLAPELLTVY